MKESGISATINKSQKEAKIYHRNSYKLPKFHPQILQINLLHHQKISISQLNLIKTSMKSLLFV